MTAETHPMEVFAKVIGHMALFARDFSNRIYHSMGTDLVEMQLDDETDTTVPHPFICQRGLVRCDVRPALDVRAMVQGVAVCSRHSYGERAGCSMHPVAHDALLAAFALGGPEAVAGKHPVGYSKVLQRSWEELLGSFQVTISAHDDRIANQDSKVLSLGALDAVPIPRHLQPETALGRLTDIPIKVRPGDPMRRKRRKLR